MSIRPSSFVSHVTSGVVGSLTTLAAVVALISYRSPTSFPVVQGIDTSVCQPAAEEPGISEQARFLKELEGYNHQVVFIKEFSIYNYSCFWPGMSRDAKAKKNSENEYFELVESKLQGELPDLTGQITIGFKALAKTPDHAMAGILLTVRAPAKDQFFSDTGCGENCFGAHGLYKVSFDAIEGFAYYRLNPIPTTSSILDAYQCTLTKLQAQSAFQKFMACRF